MNYENDAQLEITQRGPGGPNQNGPSAPPSRGPGGPPQTGPGGPPSRGPGGPPQGGPGGPPMNMPPGPPPSSQPLLPPGFPGAAPEPLGSRSSSPNNRPPSQVNIRGINRCLNRFTYVWLINGTNFWFYPVSVFGPTIIGFRWTNRGWNFDTIDFRRIIYFQCF